MARFREWFARSGAGVALVRNSPNNTERSLAALASITWMLIAFRDAARVIIVLALAEQIKRARTCLKTRPEKEHLELETNPTSRAAAIHLRSRDHAAVGL